MTMKYAHLAPAHKRNAVSRLNAYGKGRNSVILKRSRRQAGSEGKRNGNRKTDPGADTNTASQTRD
jgi:hypothetical protein